MVQVLVAVVIVICFIVIVYFVVNSFEHTLPRGVASATDPACLGARTDEG